jgi:hypothetical protein
MAHRTAPAAISVMTAFSRLHDHRRQLLADSGDAVTRCPARAAERIWSAVTTIVPVLRVGRARYARRMRTAMELAGVALVADGSC